MATITQQGSTVEYGVTSFVADNLTDMNTINKNNCIAGSTCFVIATGDAYMLNSSKTWVKL